MQNSRINFPDKYAEKNYSFEDLNKASVKGSLDTLLMVFNLERVVDDEESPQKRGLDGRNII